MSFKNIYKHKLLNDKKWAAGKDELLTAFMYKPESENV
ncbi:hypothetical protein C427_0924 [Paraglaciecola psychrophila 170]|uniref:Uncharacterized protein n=1 Tax=Paraglaciecola psychrophila 170 TaxID=1129794 RepID=K6ZT10_9ALTE|nr:hypothetical protein C427_0924 [Paraglaciecola psychrophila 170]GAC39061.1 hypothetical protein GPSY_3450 [Paraglaciecola psychrophila 170]